MAPWRDLNYVCLKCLAQLMENLLNKQNTGTLTHQRSNSKLLPLSECLSGPFNPCNLKRLILRSCSMLRTLFSPSTATRLTSLEELLIADCHGLRYIVTCEDAHDNEEEIIPEDQDSQSYYGSIMFPRLKRISVVNCNLLEYILHVSFAQGLVELKRIEIWKVPQLRYVFGENIHDSHQHQNKIQIELPVLEKIALFSVPNMINICPDTYYATCSSLLEIVMDNVGLFTLSVNNLMVHSESTHPGRSYSSTSVRLYISLSSSVSRSHCCCLL